MWLSVFFLLSIPLRAYIKPPGAALVVDRDHKPTQQGFKNPFGRLDGLTGLNLHQHINTSPSGLTSGTSGAARSPSTALSADVLQLKTTIRVGACD